MIDYDSFVKAGLEFIKKATPDRKVLNLLLGDAMVAIAFPPIPPNVYDNAANVAEAYGDVYKFAAFPASVPGEILKKYYSWNDSNLVQMRVLKDWFGTASAQAFPAPNVAQSDQVRIQYYNRASSLYALAAGLQIPESQRQYVKEHAFALWGATTLNVFKVIGDVFGGKYDKIGDEVVKTAHLLDGIPVSGRVNDLLMKAKTMSWQSDQLTQQLIQAPIDAQNAEMAKYTAHVAATKSTVLTTGGYILIGFAILIFVDALTD